MKLLFIVVTTVAFAWFFYYLGQSSVEMITPKCYDTKLTLVASRVNKDEAVCVYVESWQIKGKTKRIEHVVQKKTT